MRARVISLLAGILLSCPLEALGASGAPAITGVMVQRDLETELVKLLAESGSGWSDAPDLQRALAGLGQQAASPLFEVLVANAFQEPESGSLVALSAARRHALSGALELLQPAAVNAMLDRVAQQAESDVPRICALELLERFGRDTDLGRAARLTGDQKAVLSPELEAAYRQAILQIFRRHPKALPKYAEDFGKLKPELLVAGSVAIELLESHDAFRALCDGVESRPQHAAIFLLALRRMGPKLAIPPRRYQLDSIRDCLASRDATIVILAASLLQELGDTSSIPNLISALRVAEPNVATAVHQALRALTPVDLGKQPEAWKSWYDTQVLWLRERAGFYGAQVKSGVTGDSARALQALCAHPVFAEELAPHLLWGLERQEDFLISMTCTALGRMGSWDSVDRLIEALKNTNPEVQRAARAALVAITKLDLPADAALWKIRLDHEESKQ